MDGRMKMKTDGIVLYMDAAFWSFTGVNEIPD